MDVRSTNSKLAVIRDPRAYKSQPASRNDNEIQGVKRQRWESNDHAITKSPTGGRAQVTSHKIIRSHENHPGLVRGSRQFQFTLALRSESRRRPLSRPMARVSESHGREIQPERWWRANCLPTCLVRVGGFKLRKPLTVYKRVALLLPSSPTPAPAPLASTSVQ